MLLKTNFCWELFWHSTNAATWEKKVRKEDFYEIEISFHCRCETKEEEHKEWGKKCTSLKNCALLTFLSAAWTVEEVKRRHKKSEQLLFRATFSVPFFLQHLHTREHCKLSLHCYAKSEENGFELFTLLIEVVRFNVQVSYIYTHEAL